MGWVGVAGVLYALFGSSVGFYRCHSNIHKSIRMTVGHNSLHETLTVPASQNVVITYAV